MTCTSPYGYGVRGSAEDSTGTPTTTGGPQGGTGSANGGAGGTGGALPPSSPTPTHEKAGTGTSMPTGGCALGGGGSSSLTLAALALLGLVVARRRRA
jgi:MYXO-CTERM domain-containing protein